jgi:hypothetical protein
LNASDVRLQPIQQCEWRRLVFVDTHDLDVPAHVAELIRKTQHPTHEPTLDDERHGLATGLRVCSLEANVSGGRVETAVSDDRVLPAWIRPAGDAPLLVDDEVEQDLRGLTPSAGDHDRVGAAKSGTLLHAVAQLHESVLETLVRE